MSPMPIRSPISPSGRGCRATNGRRLISINIPTSNAGTYRSPSVLPCRRVIRCRKTSATFRCRRSYSFSRGRGKVGPRLRRGPGVLRRAREKGYSEANGPKQFPRSSPMDDITKREPVKITAEDINPRYNWGRHLPVLGAMGVDFEERVDYRRMHRYRLGRAKAAPAASHLGALLLFDANNIRYVTSTKIGEWARDKLSRWALLPRGGDPILWDFGSAAVHHKLYSPWLKPENCKAGLVGLRGTVDPAFGLMKHHAEEMASILKAAGVAKMPIGVDIIEPPMMFELEKAGLKVKDGQQVMLEAREVKSADEIALLNRAAAMVDG